MVNGQQNGLVGSRLLVMIDDIPTVEEGEGKEIVKQLSYLHGIHNCRLCFLQSWNLRLEGESEEDQRPAERAAQEKGGDIAACIVDCDLGLSRGLSFRWTLDLCRRLKHGLPPFGESFREKPFALYTRRVADLSYYAENAPSGVKVFCPWKNDQYDNTALVTWVAKQFRGQ